VSQSSSIAHLCAINMSLGSYSLYTSCPCDGANAFNMALGAAIQAAETAGIVTFGASGNGGSTTGMQAPACLGAVHAVAAVYDLNLGREPDAGTYADALGTSYAPCYDASTAPDKLVCFSNQGPCSELAGPGRSISAPFYNGGVAAFTGTSQAAPHVAGVAALMCQRGRFADLTPDDIVTIMKNTGVVISGTTPQIVRVDARGAVDATPIGLPAMLEHAWLAAATALVALGAAAIRRLS